MSSKRIGIYGEMTEIKEIKRKIENYNMGKRQFQVELYDKQIYPWGNPNVDLDTVIYIHPEFYAILTHNISIYPCKNMCKSEKEILLSKIVGEILEIIDRQNANYILEASYLREKIFIRVDDIIYITHHQKGSVLHVEKRLASRYCEGNIIIARDFDYLESVLKHRGFVSPHNSYLVNLRFVTAFDYRESLIEVDHQMFTVSRKRKDQFFQTLFDYINQSYRHWLVRKG